MPSKKPSETTQLRIIGGEHRGRKITVPVCEQLRPTHDRVRETVFNWLQPVISGSYCLDAFAGSGALGFEALSRGAKRAVFVESNATQARAIESNRGQLGFTDSASVVCTSWPGVPLSDQFDIVFLDPPFDSDLIGPVWQTLIDQNALTENCWVYIEHGIDKKPTIPTGFSCHRSKQTKQVVYALYCRSFAQN